MGPHGCTPWETLHVFDQGMLQYIVESLHDIFGEKSAGKRQKDAFVKLFKVINNYLNRQSERDFPRRSVRFSPLDGSRVTASEVRGNSVIFILCFYVKDAILLLNMVFDKWHSQHNGSACPSVKGCREALTDLLCYEKWVKEENAAGEVLASSATYCQKVNKDKTKLSTTAGHTAMGLTKDTRCLQNGTHSNTKTWQRIVLG